MYENVRCSIENNTYYILTWQNHTNNTHVPAFYHFIEFNMDQVSSCSQHNTKHTLPLITDKIGLDTSCLLTI